MEELIDKYETLMIKNPSQIRWVLTELIKEAQDKKLTLGGVNLQSEQFLQVYKQGFEAATQSLIEANNLVKAKKLQ